MPRGVADTSLPIQPHLTDELSPADTAHKSLRWLSQALQISHSISSFKTNVSYNLQTQGVKSGLHRAMSVKVALPTQLEVFRWDFNLCQW